MSAKQAIGDKLQGNVAAYLRCDGLVNNQIKKGLLLQSVSEFFFKWVNIWQIYKQERDCLVHFVRWANTLLKDGKDGDMVHAFAHPTDGARGIMFSGCSSVCACVRAMGRGILRPACRRLPVVVLSICQQNHSKVVDEIVHRVHLVFSSRCWYVNSRVRQTP